MVEQPTAIYICNSPTAETYHNNPECRGLSRCRYEVVEVTQEEAEEKSQLMPDGSVIIEARTSISDVNEILDIEISEDEDSDTIGGYICSAMGRIPERGETFTEPNLFRAEIISADRRKIQKIRIYVLDEETE